VARVTGAVLSVEEVELAPVVLPVVLGEDVAGVLVEALTGLDEEELGEGVDEEVELLAAGVVLDEALVEADDEVDELPEELDPKMDCRN
jgi:hypothetical protein